MKLWNLLYIRINAGKGVPYFYLPVKKINFSSEIECCLFIIYPLVLVLFVIANALLCAVTDFFHANNLLRYKQTEVTKEWDNYVKYVDRERILK